MPANCTCSTAPGEPDYVRYRDCPEHGDHILLGRKFDGSRTCWLEDVECRASPLRSYGGQQVGVDASVMVWHRPTGIAVIVSDERSMIKNRLAATERLREILHTLYPEAE